MAGTTRIPCGHGPVDAAGVPGAGQDPHLQRLRDLLLAGDGGDPVLFQVIAQTEVHLARRAAPQSDEIADLALAMLAAIDGLGRQYRPGADGRVDPEPARSAVLALMDRLDAALRQSAATERRTSDPPP